MLKAEGLESSLKNGMRDNRIWYHYQIRRSKASPFKGIKKYSTQYFKPPSLVGGTVN